MIVETPVLQDHFDNFTQNVKKPGYEMTKISSKYNSSIHQCKGTCSHLTSKNGHPKSQSRKSHNFDAENYISSSVCSKFNGIPTTEGGFATYSNISAVPNHHEDEVVYSSADEIAANLMQHGKAKEQNPKSQKAIVGRYNESFGNNELQVDTSSNALLLKDICEIAKTSNYEQN